VSRTLLQLADAGLEVSLPMPVFPLIEDVGWWQGASGAAVGQPYRNAFPRRHCLADYQALAQLARQLKVRIALGMVLCEWDRSNYLRRVPDATWMGRTWDNRDNQGPWLDEAAEYLNDQREFLELGLHGIGHEFWNRGRMERSEFHDRHGKMRPRAVIESHLRAFGVLLEQNGLDEFPRLFIPPALYHSFGNGADSMQALLHRYGIRYVITHFAKARQYAALQHEKIGWEAGVGLLERGVAPVSWDQPACSPSWDFSGPVLPLHWGNLLHRDPARNSEIIDGWARLLLEGTAGMERILVGNLEGCWSQAAAFYLGRLVPGPGTITVDLQSLPDDLPDAAGGVILKLKGRLPRAYDCRGGRLVAEQRTADVATLQLLPDEKCGLITIRPC
jgi:hypothetical protein